MTLNLKQRRLVNSLPIAGSVSEAGRMAGYGRPQSAHRALKNDEVRSAAEKVLAEAGITRSVYGTVLREILASDDARLKLEALKFLSKILGDEAPRKNLQVTASYSDFAQSSLYGQKAKSKLAQPSHEVVAQGPSVHLVPTVSML